MSTPPTLFIKQAGLFYANEAIFSQLNLTIAPGKWVALLGQSGIGKSSLLRMIAGLTSPNERREGHIEVDNGEPLQQQIAYMAQTDLLLPWANVLDNVLLGMRLRNHSRAERVELRKKALSLLKQVGLEKVQHFFPAQLSGGMRQRTALVRTMMEDKSIILIDEPFSSLDAITRYKLQELTAELFKHKTVIFITHDPAEALRLAHEVYLMQGQPAHLKLITHLHSETPRSLTNADVSTWHPLLFAELTQAIGAL